MYIYIYISSFYTQIPEFTEINHLIPFDIHRALYAWIFFFKPMEQT